MDGSHRTLTDRIKTLEAKEEALQLALATAGRDRDQRYQLLEQQHHALEESKIQLEHSHALLMDTLESINDAVLVLDLTGKVIIHNQQFLKMFGLQSQADTLDKHIIRQSIAVLIENMDELTSVLEFNKQFPDQPGYCVLRLIDDRFIECFTTPRMLGGTPIGRVWSFNDISEIKRNEQLAVHNSHHDILTGLPNRNLLVEWLKREATRESSKNSSKSVAVLFIGVDGFKTINDTRGIEFGDRLLCLISQRLKSLAGLSALARHGGDEFVILIDNSEDGFRVALLAEEILQLINQPFTLQGQTVHISVSIGIALYPQDGDNPETLLRKSNIAMFHAKQKGRNNFQFFAEQLEQQAHERLRLRNGLKRALHQSEFHMVYQPKILLSDATIHGAEALIRWKPANGAPVSPAQFIPSAEENGFIVDIGEWVINEVGRQLAAWRAQGAVCPVSLNISAKHFQVAGLVGSISDMLIQYQLDPALIEVEVTESAFIEDLTKTVKALTDLQSMGVGCSIDDFGTGFSSLSYLLTLPIDVLKIDKVFIDNVAHSQKQQSLVKSILELAHTLDMRVVAEGIEDLATADLLKAMNCDMAQGFYFSRPLLPDDFYQILTAGGSLPV